MKYLLVLLSFFSSLSSACVLGPKSMVPTIEEGFVFKESNGFGCENCSYLTVDAPENFKEQPISHALFIVYAGDDLISKSISYLKYKKDEEEFAGIVSRREGIRYEIELLYGSGTCKTYSFKYNG